MKKLLIVDDEESIRVLYTYELIEEGYEVITTDDGSRLMSLIEEENPDLVVMDIKLSHDNGLNLLMGIRDTYYNLPVVMCTAYPDFKYDMRSIAADYYVVKSSDLNELKYKIKMALDGVMPFIPGAMLNDVKQMVTTLENRH